MRRGRHGSGGNAALLSFDAKQSEAVVESLDFSLKTSCVIRGTEEGIMTGETAIRLFEIRQVRSAWDSEKGKWYFAVVDVVAVLTA